MSESQYSAFLAVMLPSIVHLVAEADGVSEDEATTRFYKSRLFEKLADEKLKLWHYSPETLCELYVEERTTGKLVFPEEAC